MRRPYFPMYTDISDLRVVVVGSGEEARKCIRTLAAYTGHLIVISETADPQLLSIKEAYGFELRCRQYAREELFGADIAVAASGDAGIDGDIYAACKCLGIRVHTCGNEAKSDFFFEQREKLPEPVRWCFWYAAIAYVLLFAAYGPNFRAIDMMYAGF